MARPETRKEELPLATVAEIAETVAAFENCILPHRHWTHRAHLCVAVTYLRQMPFDQALTRLRANINTYNRQCGDPDGYNETITVLFLRRIHADMQCGASRNSLPEEISRLFAACSVDWLYRYYSKALIWSDTAKAGWIKPDLEPLDF